MKSNVLYLVVLPVIHLSSGLTEQVLTLLPNRDQATTFLQTQLDGFSSMFLTRANQYLTGDVVTRYECEAEPVPGAVNEYLIRATTYLTNQS
jgi:heme-degrading monooxygenase HmoA